MPRRNRNENQGGGDSKRLSALLANLQKSWEKQQDRPRWKQQLDGIEAVEST